ncbi:alcohol oxidase [Xylariaceae sp. FL0662B]|nr:alcohol oxidase [Xylariaceae sp. FL0662B]
MTSDTYDIVIIGGGTAGLVLATRLSEDPRVQVVVIECGEDWKEDSHILTPGMWPLLSNSPSDWAFRTAPQKGLGDKELQVPQGRLLGGSSAINSFLFTPTSKATIDVWSKLGNKGWDFETFNESLKKAYTLHKSPETTVGNGPIQLAVHKSEPENTWSKAWIEGLETLGFPYSDPFSGTVCGPFDNPESVDPKKKQRSFSANAYLEPALDRANLTVLTSSTVTRILLKKMGLEDVIAEGVQISTRDGLSRIITARKEVILAAGTINSPRLLELSGIGDVDVLQRLGIEVMVENPHVGENLQNHVFTGVVFDARDDEKTLDAYFRQEPDAGKAAMEAYAHGTGPLGSSSIVASAQLPFPGIQTDKGQQDLDQLLQSLDIEADLQRSPKTSTLFAAAKASFVRSILSSPTEASAHYVFGPAALDGSLGNHVTVAVMLSHPLSQGSVHITSASPEYLSSNGGLDIDPRYLSHPLDLEVLARHVQFAEQAIGRAAPLSCRLKPRTELFGDLEQAKQYVQHTAQGSHHYTGTCSMMSQDMGGVIDDKLRVYGCANLRVCDASIIPITPRANTQAVVYGLAEMGAEIIKGSI